MKFIRPYIIPALILIVAVLTWKMWSDRIGEVTAAVLAFFGLGGGVIKGVKRRAKKIHDNVGPHPAPGIDATNRLERRRSKD